MTRHYTFTGERAMSANGIDADVEFRARYSYTPGRPATWCRAIGTWDPPDPPDLDILTVEVGSPGHWYKLTDPLEVQDWSDWLIEEMAEELAEHAIDEECAAHERAMEYQAEERRYRKED